jgi:hypothetical protein
MSVFAARVPRELERAIRRLDDRRVPIAEVARRVCAEAERIGLTRPGYERIRILVHDWRDQQDHRREVLETVVDVAYRVRPVSALADVLLGIELPPLR